MQKEYIIKVGATAEYLNLENSSNSIARIISSLEGNKIFIHDIENEEVEISQYERTQKIKVPLFILEEVEEIENIELEEKENKVDLFFNKNKSLIIGIILGLFISVGFINLQNIDLNKVEAVEIKQTEKDLFNIYSDRLIIIEKKIDFELNKQKGLRDEVRSSIYEVKKIQKEKEEIMKQKIELANS